MTARNKNFQNLADSYLFPQVRRRQEALLAKNPGVRLSNLSIGDTVGPIPAYITSKLVQACQELGTPSGYKGYGPEQGDPRLREKIATLLYHNLVALDEVFISDGAKCDIARLQMMFGSDVSIAVQDPSYPVYVDSSLMMGQKKCVLMPCTKENGFFPNLQEATDLIYFCSPNNPTGASATKEQLTELVSFAKKNHSLIIFDAAYALFIQNPALPKSIYEIEGADEVAIEIGSFSKIVGFTGVRLSWSVVPKKLRFVEGQSVHKDWNRMMTTCFNGASVISQAGGLAALDPTGWQEMQQVIAFYRENASILKGILQESGLEVFGGEEIPYLWARIPGKSSWEAFEELLQESHIVTTPGSGFGPSGEGFVRFSAYSHRDRILDLKTRNLV